jgi:hypothetical protein
MKREDLFYLVGKAIDEGHIDDQNIILYARGMDLKDEEIEQIQALLNSSKCKGDEPEIHDEDCPKAPVALTFDTTMRRCLGRKKKCAQLVDEGKFDQLFDKWHAAVKTHFGGWEDKDVQVDGVVKDYNHEGGKYNLLLGQVVLKIGNDEREVPKIWSTVDPSEYASAKKSHLSRGEEVTLIGRIEWDNHLHFYHLTDVTDLKVERP